MSSDQPIQRSPLSRRAFLAASAAAVTSACSEKVWTPDANHAADDFSRGPTPYIDSLQIIDPDYTGPFRTKFAPHFGMFEDSTGPDLIDQLAFAADQGFRAWEDNFMPRRTPHQQERLAQAMRDLGIEMGVFVAGDRLGWSKPTLTTADPEARAMFLQQIETGVACAQRTGATQMTVLSGRYDSGVERQYQLVNVIENLRYACDLVEPHGLSLALEPINSSQDFPAVFLDSVDDAYLICRALDRPGCRLLFDIYHQQVMDGNIIKAIDASWNEISYFQMADHPGRNEPGSGEVNYANILQHIHTKGYRGIIGMEHGVNGSGAEGEARMIARYRNFDALLNRAG